MPTQVLPITDLAKAGVIMDTPAVSLPPNVFSDVQNVRFRDGAIRKMEGEERIFQGANIVYVAYWQGPFNNMYVVVQADGDIILHLESDTTMTREPGNIFEISSQQDAPPTNYKYQHTLFNGGFNFILNNGVSTPVSISDAEDFNTIGTAAPLPNWDSYLAQENVVSVVWDEENEEIPLGREVSLDLEVVNADGTLFNRNVDGTQAIIFRVIPRDPSLPVITQRLSRLARTYEDPATAMDPNQANADNMSTLPSMFGTEADDLFSIRQEPNNWLINPRRRDTTVTPVTIGAEPGDTIEIAIQERPDITVTAGVVRAYGSLLVAGNLREVSGNRIIRTLPGTIRTSDVAPPGNVPANWNPFRNGANTADEFTLSSTGAVQDMVELQGNLYIYTTNSIHSLQQTGGNIPFGVRPVTNNYGADNLGSVLEVDGKHIVVGSDDVYVFAGHPGSIQSIADSRVRHQDLFNSGVDVRILRYSRYDELWFYSPSVAEMFIWNYRDNTWARRSQTTPVVGNVGPNTVIFTDGTSIYRSMPDTYTDQAGANYTSFVERKRLAITPEFTTETLVSVGILSEGDATFNVATVGTNRPAEVRMLPDDDPEPTPFASRSNYKADIRTHGRLLNYRIQDTIVGNAAAVGWSIAGLQFDIGTGGTR